MLTKVHLVKAMVFPVVMYGCESWTIKTAERWRIDAELVLEKTLESLLDCKEIQPVNPKGNQSWIFIGSFTETPILWPPDAKNWLIGKDPDVEKDWRREEKGRTEDEMVGWHHQLDGHAFEQDLGVGDRQGSLACCSPWGCKKLDTTEQLNWTELAMLNSWPKLFKGDFLNSWCSPLKRNFVHTSTSWKHSTFKLPWWSSRWDSSLSMQGARVQSLMGELRSHMLSVQFS